MRITTTYPTSLDELSEKQRNTGKFKMIDGELHLLCGKHKIYEPVIGFTVREHNTATGYMSYCRLAMREKQRESFTRNKEMAPLDAHQIERDVILAKELLTECGYDIQQNIHEQFMVRYERYKKEIGFK